MPYNINWIDLASRGVSHPAQDLCAFTTSKGEVIQGHRAMKISIAATSKMEENRSRNAPDA
jgi:hypothetical protein